MIRRRLAALIDLNKHVGVIRHILCINTRILRAEIQLQARSIELEGRIAADCRCSCHRSLAVRAVFTVGRIKTVAVGRLAIGFLCLPSAMRGTFTDPVCGIRSKAFLIIDRRCGDETDSKYRFLLARIADCNACRREALQDLGRRVGKCFCSLIVCNITIRDRTDTNLAQIRIIH